jgi:hypothetical protein
MQTKPSEVPRSLLGLVCSFCRDVALLLPGLEQIALGEVGNDGASSQPLVPRMCKARADGTVGKQGILCDQIVDESRLSSKWRQNIDIFMPPCVPRANVETALAVLRSRVSLVGEALLLGEFAIGYRT